MSEPVPEVGDTPHSRTTIHVTPEDYLRLHQIQARYIINDGVKYTIGQVVTKLLNNWASRTDNIEERKE